MRNSIFYTIICLLSFVNSSFAEGKRALNHRDEIYEKINFHRDHLNQDSTFYYLHELIAFYRSEKSEEDVVEVINDKITTLLMFKKEEEAFRLALTTFNNYCGEIKLKNCSGCQEINYKLMMFMIKMRNYREGIAYLNRFSEESKDVTYYYRKADMYFYLEIPDSSLLMVQKGIDLAEKKGEKRLLILAYNNYGLIAKELNRMDLAIKAFSSAISIVKSERMNIQSYGNIIGNLGWCYLKKGNYAKAYELLLVDSEASLADKNFDSFILAEIDLAEIDIKRKNYQKSIVRLKNILNNYNNYLRIDSKINALGLLKESYRHLSNESEYDFYEEKWIDLYSEHYTVQLELQKNMIKEYSVNLLRQVTQKIELEKKVLSHELIAQHSLAP